MKEKSCLFGEERRKAARENIKRFDWAQGMQNEVIMQAEFWREKSDDDLWKMMFSPTLKRAYHVGNALSCPDCGKPLPIFGGTVDARQHPWKVRCPECGSLFPKNDFYAYYLSGLDKKGFFRYELADDTLLTCDEHPGDCESLYRGPGAIDDGEGAATGWCTQKRWHYIAYYLVEGQWRQLIVSGIQYLSQAYFLTGNKQYAHKAAVLLDRVADFLPYFNYARQGLTYDAPGDCGYVSTWHDSNMELRSLVVGYDMIFDAIEDDEELVTFLSGKARILGLENTKDSCQKIRENIEIRILEDVLKNPRKVTLNFPGQDVLLTLIMLILGDKEHISEAIRRIDLDIEQACAVDGVTGERGIGGYASFTADSSLILLEMLYLYDEKAAEAFVESHPQIEKTFHFLTDLYLLGRYYPRVGDADYFGAPVRIIGNSSNLTRRFSNVPVPGFNLFSLLWKLFRSTGNQYYQDAIRMIAKQHPVICDIGDEHADEIIAASVDKPSQTTGSLNLKKWQLAVLKSGSGKNECALWMHYLPITERHGHRDTLNIGLFGYGLDLLPDAGYPPVQFGGWFTNKVKWYSKPWIHNLVVVDRREDSINYDDCKYGGKRSQVLLWYDKPTVHAVSVSAPQMWNTDLYERTCCLLKIDENAFVILDLFRVKGGKEHIKTMHSTFGTCRTFGFDKRENLDLPDEVLLEEVSGVSADAEPICGADWTIEDRYEINQPSRDIHLAYYDLTDNHGMYEAKMWVNASSTQTKTEAWVPVLLNVRRSQEESLNSCFSSVIVPYEGTNPITGIEKESPIVYTLILQDGKKIGVHFHFEEEAPVVIDIDMKGEHIHVSNEIS